MAFKSIIPLLTMKQWQQISVGFVITLSINLNVEAKELSLVFESSQSGGVAVKDSDDWGNVTDYTISSPIQAIINAGKASHTRTTYQTDFTVTPIGSSYIQGGVVTGSGGYALNTGAYQDGNLLVPDHSFYKQTEMNGVSTSGIFSYSTGLSTINTPVNSFVIDNYIGGRGDVGGFAQCSGLCEGELFIWGSAIFDVTTNVSFFFDVDKRYDHLNIWTENTLFNAPTTREPSFIQSITKKLKDYDNSQHYLNEKGKKLFIKGTGTTGANGVRGSINTAGTSIFTASPGILSYDLEFGQDEALILPFAFGENKDDATLEIFFDGVLLGTAFGADYELDELSFIDLDISNYLGMSGSLDFVLNTTGSESANIYIPESIEVSSVPVPAAVWLFSSGLIGLIGLARHKKA